MTIFHGEEGDYADNHYCVRWLETENAGENWPAVLNILHMEKFLDNDLSKSAKIYISDHETEDIENCVLVYPQ